MTNWNEFYKDTIGVIVLGLIYVLICINSISLVKIFPYTTFEKTTCRHITFLDYIYPTDLEQPPYQKGFSCSGDKQSNLYIPPATDCAYQGTDYTEKFGELFAALKDNVGEVHWPYDWLMEDPDKSNWLNYFQKFKFANIVLNQTYVARWIMKSFLGLHFFRYIPDFLLFLSIPLAGTTSSLVPILPTIIYGLALLVGFILIFVTFGTWLFVWFPTGQDVFRCKGTPANETDNSRCGPSIWIQLFLFIFVQAPFLYFTIRSASELKNQNGDFWGTLWWGLLALLCFSIFVYAGGFLLAAGLASSTIVWIGTIISTIYPMFLSPQSILNILYCNKDIIALIITATITLTAQEKNTLDSSIVNTMWGAWGILVLIKILQNIKNLMPKT